MTGLKVAEFTKRYKGTRSDVDRHGNRRWYTINPEGRKIRMRETPGTDAFEREWRRIRESTAHRRAAEGTLEWLIQQYFASPEFQSGLKASTQAVRRRILAKVIEDGGDLIARDVTSADIRAGRNSRADTPAAANNRMKAISALYEWAKEVDLAEHNPVRGVKRLKEAKEGNPPWTIEDCLAYEERHPPGTMARLVYSLGLYTASRVSDVHRLGPQHEMTKVFTDPRTGKDISVRGIRIRQEKTGTVIWLPIVPPLAAVLDATPKTQLSYAITSFGKPFTAKGLSNKMREWCDQAGLPDRSMHGLRKATATRCAALGVSTRGIASITGHKTLSEVQHYTEEVDQALLAFETMSRAFGGK